MLATPCVPTASRKKRAQKKKNREKGLARSQPSLLVCKPRNESAYQYNQNRNPKWGQNPTPSPVNNPDELQHDKNNGDFVIGAESAVLETGYDAQLGALHNVLVVPRGRLYVGEAGHKSQVLVDEVENTRPSYNAII